MMWPDAMIHLEQICIVPKMFAPLKFDRIYLFKTCTKKKQTKYNMILMRVLVFLFYDANLKVVSLAQFCLG